MQSKIEAHIDFPDDVVAEKNDLEKINIEVQSLIQSMQKHLDDKRRGERLREGLHVVIIGEPNVGKSTLFNFLAKRDIAIVSEYAGTTRDVLEAHIDIDGYPIILSDTAGVRESSDLVELESISRARKKSYEADLRIELFLSKTLQNMNCNVSNKDAIYVLSKADDVTDNHNIKINNIKFLPVSILKGIGTEKLISVIKEKVEEKFSCDRNTPLITRQRHRNCIQRAVEYLLRFNIDNPIEIISEDLRHAAIELGAVTGEISVEEMLDDIFNNFCVGK